MEFHIPEHRRRAARGAALLLVAGLVVLGRAAHRAELERRRGSATALLALGASPGSRLDLNRAGRDEIMLLPGLGPRRADLILARRRLRGPFPSPAALSEIPGLPQNRIEELLPLLIASPRPEPTSPMRLDELAQRIARSERVRQLVRMALEEDLGTGDVTTELLVPAELRGEARIVAKEAGVICGLELARMVLEVGDADVEFSSARRDGDRVSPGDEVAALRGRAGHILSTERIILNFLQRLSGIATTTRRFVDAVAGLECAILETRKTVPGWRLLDKYAVAAGGGTLHRLGLDDQILAKENHFALARRSGLCTSFAGALELLVARRSSGMICEVEVETLDELDAALRVGVDIVLLDDMSRDEMREAVRRRDRAPRLKNGERIRLEASGGITLDTVRAVAETGVDRISVGALTHSVKALDLSLLVDWTDR
ncbi:MAG: carboxylating nicotinate-nucleotide diphosphorylase [Planctomycetota bacterium]